MSKKNTKNGKKERKKQKFSEKYHNKIVQKYYNIVNQHITKVYVLQCVENE